MHSDLMEFSEKTCMFIRKRTVNELGLFRTESYDVENNTWATEICDPDDFGDFAPFMAWYDLLNGGSENMVWIKGQLRLMNSLLRQNAGFYYPFSSGSGIRRSGIFPAYPQNHLDLSLGLNILFALTSDQSYMQAAKSICDAIARHAISASGFVYGSVIPSLNLYFPRFGFLRHKPEVSGVFVEEFSNLYRNSGEVSYMESAKRMAGAWAGTPTFREHGICCDQVYPFIDREATERCTLGKMNTNMSCGLIRLWEVSHDTLIKEYVERNMEGLEHFRSPDGPYRLAVRSRDGRVMDASTPLVQNHMAMGALIDAYEAMHSKRYLTRAMECADFWISKQSENGLFRMMGGSEDGWSRCDIDTHADVLTILSRLYLLNRKGRYREAIEKGTGAFGLFQGNESFFRVVEYSDGRVVEKRNELKFLGGFLKGIMSSYTALSGTKRINGENLRLLMRDR